MSRYASVSHQSAEADHCIVYHIQDIDGCADGTGNDSPLLGIGGCLLGSLVLLRLVKAVDLGGIDDGNDAEGNTTANGGEDGPQHIVVGLGRRVAGLVVIVIIGFHK